MFIISSRAFNGSILIYTPPTNNFTIKCEHISCHGLVRVLMRFNV